MLLIGDERAEGEKQRADQAEAALEQERQRAQVLGERLPDPVIEPESIW